MDHIRGTAWRPFCRLMSCAGPIYRLLGWLDAKKVAHQHVDCILKIQTWNEQSTTAHPFSSLNLRAPTQVLEAIMLIAWTSCCLSNNMWKRMWKKKLIKHCSHIWGWPVVWHLEIQRWNMLAKLDICFIQKCSKSDLALLQFHFIAEQYWKHDQYTYTLINFLMVCSCESF